MKCRLSRYCTCFSFEISYMVTENKEIGRFAGMFCLCSYYKTTIWLDELENGNDLLFCSIQLYNWYHKELDRHPRFSTWHRNKSAVITWGISSCTGNRFSVNICPKKQGNLSITLVLVHTQHQNPSPILKTSKHHTLTP